jgi:dTDP-4-dehydrorhamnose reductase
MRALVLGSGGQLGHDLLRAAWLAGIAATGRDHGELDVTDANALKAAFLTLRPEIVVNAAAYTAVDRAESEPERALAVNCGAARQIADLCAAHGAALVHISTDYVFDGSKIGPYIESDDPNPLSVYGRSKEAGERAVRAALARHVILRTSWLFGAHGQNFVKTMLRLADERDALCVVADQIGCPTPASYLAEAIIAVCRAIGEGSASWGTFHYAGAGQTNWYDFAQAIVDLASCRTGRRPQVIPIRTEDYPTPARRPANSALDCSRFEACYGVRARPWPAGLAPMLDAHFAATAAAKASA